MFKEFKEFALKGNALELAVGVVIGTAFQTIVKSLVNDIIMPLFSALIGNVDYSEWTWTIGNTTIPYGSFISAIINFLLIAFSLFLVVRYINKINKQIEEIADSFSVDEEIDIHRQADDYKQFFSIKSSLEDFEEYEKNLEKMSHKFLDKYHEISYKKFIETMKKEESKDEINY